MILPDWRKGEYYALVKLTDELKSNPLLLVSTVNRPAFSWLTLALALSMLITSLLGPMTFGVVGLHLSCFLGDAVVVYTGASFLD